MRDRFAVHLQVADPLSEGLALKRKAALAQQKKGLDEQLLTLPVQGRKFLYPPQHAFTD